MSGEIEHDESQNVEQLKQSQKAAKPTTQSFKEPKYFKWYPKVDIFMLKQVFAKEILYLKTSDRKEKWEEISTELNKEYKGPKVAERKVRERFNSLCKEFRKDELASLQKSGCDEEYDERKQLLTDAVNMQDELDSAKEENKLQLAVKENQHKVFLINLESS